MSTLNMNQFLTDLAAFAKKHDIPAEAITNFEDKKTMAATTKAGQIYNAVVNFLNDNKLYSNNQYSNVFCASTATEAINMLPPQDHHNKADLDAMEQLCVECGVPQNQMFSTMAAMQRVIASAAGRTAIQDHWVSASEGMASNTGLTAMNALYPTSALGDMQLGAYQPGHEAFGATVDTVIPDLRMALTVVLLKPHKGIMSRLIQRRTLTGAVITYVITRNELYDLQKSQDKDAYVRNSYGHRHNLVELYRRPDPTDMSLTRIEPLKANDTGDVSVLVADNIIRFGVSLNLFNMVLEEIKAYRNRFNYTDLVSEGVVIDSIYVTAAAADGSVTEKYKLSVKEQPRARLMHLQTSDQFSGDRETTLVVNFMLHQETVTDAGQQSQLFAALVPTVEYLCLRIRAQVSCDIMTGNVSSMCSFEVLPYASVKGAEPTDELKALAQNVTFTIDGFELDARYSEENLRQIDRAARSLTYVMSFEMPQGKTIIVDFSMNQTMPEQVLNVAQELQSIGIDHRNTQMFLKTMRDVHDRCVAERNDQLFEEHSDGKSINRVYISGQQVNPEIFMGTIDLDQVASIRDSDVAGDIRQHVDSYVTKALSIVHYRSQYLTQLDSNKTPTYKVLTSSPILENLLALPHIHNHMMPNGMNAERLYKEKNPGEPIEYTRTLMSGVKLEVLTSAFYYLENKMVFIPYVDGDAANVLNFAHNWDLGQFVANYTPVDNNQVNRRVFMNTREWPIVTCPIGAIIEVKNMEKKFPDITL